MERATKKYKMEGKMRRRSSKISRLPSQRIMRSRVQAYCRATQEKKSVDISLNQSTGITSTTNSNANIVLLNGIAVGTGFYNRIGQKADISSIRVSGQVYATFAADATTKDYLNTFVRGIIILDKQPSGVLPNYDSMIGAVDSAGTGTASVDDNLNPAQTGRFKILRDFTWTLKPPVNAVDTTATATVEDSAYFDEYIKFKKPIKTFYGGTAASIGSLQTNAIYMIWRAQYNITVSAQAGVTNATCRTRFFD